MVYLALSQAAAIEAISVAEKTGAAIWVGADLMSHEEHYKIAAQGVNLTRFEYALADAPADVVSEALATIVEHHPGETVWIQHVP